MEKYAIISNAVLLIWYALAMIGVEISGKYLVTQSYKDEWLFMAIPIVTFVLFLFAKKAGKIIHIIWLSMWFITQFMSHEWYTIFQKGFMGKKDAKIEYFKDCIQLFNSDGTYIPDLYHIVLHILIIIALITTICSKSKTSVLVEK